MLQLISSGIGPSALQLPSLGQPQQKNEVHIDDRSKVPSVPSNEAKPVLPSSSTNSAENSVIAKVITCSRVFFYGCGWVGGVSNLSQLVIPAESWHFNNFIDLSWFCSSSTWCHFDE